MGERRGRGLVANVRAHLGPVIALVLAAGITAAYGVTPAGDTTLASAVAGPGVPSDADVGPIATGPAATTPTGEPVATTPGATGATVPQLPGASERVYDVGVSDTEIRVGGSTFTSGPAAVYGEQIAVGFAAGVQYVNDHGGVNGRRLVFTLYDDGADPARQLANTRRLIEVDKVFALTMVYAPIAGQYVAENRVPVVHLGQNDEEFLNPWWFPLGGPQRLASYALSNFGARELGVGSVAVFYLDVGAGNYSRAYAEDVATDWHAYGVDVPVLAPFAPDQTSCSDAIGQARDADVDFIQFELDAGHVIQCGVEAQIQGYRPNIGWGGYLIGVPVIHEALGDFSEGMYAFDAFGALYDVPEYIEYVHRVSPRTATYSSVTISYFIAALLLRDALLQLGDNITRERLAQVLNTFTDWQPGLTDDPNQPSWSWRPECHVALGSGYLIQIQKHDGELRWTQISQLSPRTPLPPGETVPPQWSSCDIFRPG